MQKNVVVGKLYTVTAADADCTVTDAEGRTLCTASAGEQKHFTATTSTITLSDPAAALTATFNRAASALCLLGGGVTTSLPAGYLACDFLRKGTQGNTSGYINTGVTMADDVGFSARAAETSAQVWLVGCGGHFNYANRQYVRIPTLTSSTNASWAWGQNKTGSVQAVEGVYSTSLNFKNDRKALLNRAELQADMPTLSGENYGQHVDVFALTMLHENHPSYGFMGRLHSLQISKGSEIIRDYVPCVNELGVPCFFDKIGKTDYKSATKEAFIAGFTLKQSSKLGKHLPAGGGNLTISLPTGYEQDAAVAESLETARAKGWTLTVQTYEAEAASATFGMRRVWVRRVQDEHGGYVDADGVRCSVEWCNAIYAPDGSEPDAHGYEPFRSVEAACEYWGLAAYVDPEAEQELLTN
jgi:hypothetical protein